jgi:holliday junction DNA helicase RuvA
MISYLKGTIVGVQKYSATRTILIVDVNGVGYELQILPNWVQTLPAIGKELQVFTHLQFRDEQPLVYGFASMAQRDLFRQLISVSGIGAQLAIALLDTLNLPDLIQAIVSGNTRLLATTPGVGKKTAERLALELRTKLAEWRQYTGLEVVPTPGLTPAIQEDVEMTLLALGYTASEVMQALQAIASNAELVENADAETWIKAAIACLS